MNPPPIPSKSFSLNELALLASQMNSLQARLVLAMQFLRFIRMIRHDRAMDLSYLSQIEINPLSFDVTLSDGDPIQLSVETEASLMADSDDDSLGLPHFVAVVAFFIIFGSNPFLGREYYDRVVLSDEWEKKYFGQDRCFIFYPDSPNGPDPHYQRRTIELWSDPNYQCLADIMKAYFIDNDTRSIENLPLTLYEMLAMLSTNTKSNRLILQNESSGEQYLLTDGKKWLDPHSRLIGETEQRIENGRTDLYLYNYTDTEWRITTPSGKHISTPAHGQMPVRSGMKIEIGDSIWSVKQQANY